MEILNTADPIRFQTMTTQEIRENFLIRHFFEPGCIQLYYTDLDRAIVGSIVPTDSALELTASKELASDYFTQRREIGILNIGAAGIITVDGREYPMDNRDCLYIGRGSKQIQFASAQADEPAEYYLLSYPAAKNYPTTLSRKADATAVTLGSKQACNERTICRQYIHPDEYSVANWCWASRK